MPVSDEALVKAIERVMDIRFPLGKYDVLYFVESHISNRIFASKFLNT